MVELAPGHTSAGRRERRRSATAGEIKEAARRLLLAGGRPALSTREIARKVGLSAAAIYRYFPSHDALVDAIAADIAGELSGEIAAARDAAPVEPAARVRAVARAFRGWARRNPHEFGLVLGDPRGGAGTVHIGTLFGASGDAGCLGAWAAVYGLVAAEVFGYLGMPAGAAGVHFEVELAKLLPALAGVEGAPPPGTAAQVRYRLGWGVWDVR
ncbi:TetR/AcrR family transcriptional regulator [Phytohabitans houttuyneae]|uniref:TetR family transcriptional regulator n=1 Tax=Phytohabitans houttuyneae TaxID=1076126 RepID=A0A6V8K011_9ACTN|nr:TetR/AcrR family transcriptional regulator [Phytohabitans houttuyneae]GFJ76860.1 TetR family transcriptional regulator [Phytohabitans houttuyneae]